MWLIVQIPDFTFCSLWLKSKADIIAYLVIITYLLSNSQRQCISAAYNTPPGVSQLFEPWTIYSGLACLRLCFILFPLLHYLYYTTLARGMSNRTSSFEYYIFKYTLYFLKYLKRDWFLGFWLGIIIALLRNMILRV